MWHEKHDIGPTVVTLPSLPPIWQISNYTALTLSVGWQERYAACKADYNLSTKVQANFYKGQFNKKSKINIAVTETTAHKYEQLLLSL